MPSMLILWIDATNSIVYEWVKIAIIRQRAKGGKAERRNGRTAEGWKGGKAEWQNGRRVERRKGGKQSSYLGAISVIEIWKLVAGSWELEADIAKSLK